MLQRSLRADVQVEMKFDDELWPVDVDPGELELAILNICVNSRDAMPEGGTIRFRREIPRTLPQSVTVSIADSGVGMTKEVQSRAFEPFFTTKEVGKGSGLGLAQVYGFLAQSNGQVAIESMPGKGTTVSLTFPRSDKPGPCRSRCACAGVGRRKACGAPARTRGYVLLVEDDVTVAELTVHMLESIGFSVRHEKSAAAALDAISAGDGVDIVFSDVMMPGGMSGVDLAREIRKRWPGLPVVLTTGYMEGEDSHDGGAGGAGEAVPPPATGADPECTPLGAPCSRTLAPLIQDTAIRTD